MSTADLTILKTPLSTTVSPGSQVTFIIDAENGGPDGVIGATVTDIFDPNLINVSWTTAGSGSANLSSGVGNINASVNLASILETVTFNVTATVSPTITSSSIT